MQRRRTGSKAEAFAADFLRKQGCSIIERNVRYPFGEIDIVALQKETVVFVEVRSSRGGDLIRPSESIGAKKIERLTRAAFRFLQEHPVLQKSPVRFDCIIITDVNADPRISWIKNAFEPARL
ncbi:YraN family protein [Thermodesulforhabdus norvegica]|uniref:YraN family protein n=1 Tax=Thermodesulforhabdus norvegica TaxID=39841 RepID=UPI000B833DFA|nr:YraN family protein [Thermodesulforhabdus norvegica]